MERASSDDAPFSALAFKIMSDPFVGTLTFTRIYSGVLESGTSVFNSVKVGFRFTDIDTFQSMNDLLRYVMLNFNKCHGKSGKPIPNT